MNDHAHNILLMVPQAAATLRTQARDAVQSRDGDTSLASIRAKSKEDGPKARGQRLLEACAMLGDIPLGDAPDARGADSMYGCTDKPVLVHAGGVSYVIVNGPIFSSECYELYYCGGTLMADLIRAMDAAGGAATTRAILVIDSPGGMANGMDQVVNAVRRLKASKPLTAVAVGMMASGSYMLGCLADGIVASRMSLIGSLGAIRSRDLIDDTKALEMEGIRREVIQVPGDMKRVTPGPITDDLLEHERTVMNEVAYWPLRDVVVEGRAGAGLTAEAIDALRGATFAANQAAEMGLIDAVVDIAAFVQDEMLAARAGGEASETRYRRGEANMAGESAKPGAGQIPANVAASDILAARPDVLEAAKVQLGDHIAKLVNDQVAGEVKKASDRPATADELAKICGEDADGKALAFDLLKAGASVSAAQGKVIEVLRGKHTEAATKLAQVQGVAAKGGGGGEAAAVNGVATGKPAGEIEQLTALVQGEMSKGATYGVALNRAYAKNPSLKTAHLKAGAGKLA